MVTSSCQTLSDMEREDYLSKITCLTTVIDQFRDSYSLMKSSLASAEKRSVDAEERNVSLQSQVTRLEEVICRLTDEIRSLREEVSKQSDYTKRHNKDVLRQEEPFLAQ